MGNARKALLLVGLALSGCSGFQPCVGWNCPSPPPPPPDWVSVQVLDSPVRGAPGTEVAFRVRVRLVGGDPNRTYGVILSASLRDAPDLGASYGQGQVGVPGNGEAEGVVRFWISDRLPPGTYQGGVRADVSESDPPSGWAGFILEVQEGR